MLVINRVGKEVAGRALFRDVTFAANRGKPVGLVGPNGSGKTTLLRIIAGLDGPSSGRLEMPPGARVGYLSQGQAPSSDHLAGELFPSAFGEDSVAEALGRVGAEMAGAKGADFERLAVRYEWLLELLSSGRGGEARRLRDELGIRVLEPGQPAQTLSGGELTKLALIELVLGEPDIVLLDEPTNHLDIDGIRWVEQWLRGHEGAAIIVSHDRALLDACVQQVVAFEPRRATAESFPGGYSDYLEALARREAAQLAAYHRQERHEQRLKDVISAVESRSRYIENSTINFAIRKKAAKIARRGVTLRARLERELEAEEHIERPAKAQQAFDGSFVAEERGSGLLAWAQDLRVAIGGRVLIDRLSFEVRRGERLIVQGPNGSGKTTLLRVLLGELQPAGGIVALAGSAHLGFLPQVDPSEREPEGRTPVEIIRAERATSEAEVNNLLHHYLFAHEQLHTRLCDLSYGERRRFALARLVLTGANLLVLDEPANHLDLPSREAFESALASFPGAAVVVSHDLFFIEKYASKVIALYPAESARDRLSSQAN